MAKVVALLCLSFFLYTADASKSGDMKLTLKSDGPAVRGSKVTFIASVSNYNGEKLKYVYWDDGMPQHKDEYILTSNTSVWTVEYEKEYYEPRDYLITVEIQKEFYFTGIWVEVDRNSLTFKLTETLNGELQLIQNNTKRPNQFISVNQTVLHTIKLPDPEIEYLKANASSVVTYWFIDCIYIESTTDMSLNYTYKDSMSDHYVDALVVANNEPLPPITTTTTTTITTTTTTTTTTPKPTTTTHKPNESTKVEATTHKVAKRFVWSKKPAIKDFICHNTGIVPIGGKYTYGHYQETLSVREPITSVNITGGNWLQHGELLNLRVKYTGSPPFNYCAEYKLGPYNITGNETCRRKTSTTASEFPLVHYFSDSAQHAVVVIVENDIGKTVSRAAINIYKVTTRAQLSVIVVPVASCLLAVILVVFGVAYYQHRSRYTVEVADFDFGQQALGDYKSFGERLRDSLRDALGWPREGDEDPLVTSSSRYESMS